MSAEKVSLRPPKEGTPLEKIFAGEEKKSLTGSPKAERIRENFPGIEVFARTQKVPTKPT